MKVLLDEGVPHPLAPALPDHDVQTVAAKGWISIKNGELLRLIEADRFEAFITNDKNMQDQQKLVDRPFAVLILSTNNWPVLRSHVPEIAAALDTCRAGIVRLVDCGEFPPRLRRKPGPSPFGN